MAAVPVIINGVLMPKARDAGSKPVPAVFLGSISIAGLEVGGGPIMPDNPPDPPTVDPPPSNPPPDLVVVIKPAPATGGWGVAVKDQKLQWFFVPSESGAGPKK